jgi:HD-GYP domain-containing protein (c-di-GMP phosphodiesterase class II)/DNA-binding CsgD family transcriptional regulator
MVDAVVTIRLAELVASLSYATDLGRGQPLEHTIRQTRIALRMADLLGLGEEDREAAYYVGLLVSVYCHADAHEQAMWLGDDIELKAEVYEADMESLRALLMTLRRVGAGDAGLARARRILAFPVRGWKDLTSFLRVHSALQSQFAERIGLPPAVTDALAQSYARWDGKGEPARVKGGDIPLAVRIVALADLVEVYHRTAGVEAARAVALDRAGGQLDPALVGLFRDNAREVLAGLDEGSSWDEVIAAEPGLERRVAGDDLDGVLEAMADLVDMKSPHMAGHSRGVARLTAEAARGAGTTGAELVALRRAGFIHDLGRLGVPNTIWDQRGPLTAADRERVRLHPYLTDRMLVGLAALAPVREIAARHHERLDGSGYPRGLRAADLSPADRLLAAADAYHAMTEPRPYRAPLAPDAAAAELRAQARAGRLCGDAVGSVLKAAGHRAPVRRDWPGGLTAREVEVLALLARGDANKVIARRLVVTPRTVASHIEHIYTKLGVSSRAQATLFATQHGLVGSFEPATEKDRLNRR